ncbi:hypothetical protein [Enterococcus sp. AZ007]|uniref:hypothetical protein n=1 Tax=Enterococcus sp. AZ007 TaxID=2774839 RepID=UPI003F296DC9
MNGFEVTQRLCEELDIEYLHINFGGKGAFFTEEEYQKIKVSFAQLFLDMRKGEEK